MADSLAQSYVLSIAPRYASSQAARCVLAGMKTVEEVRRQRLAMLKAEHGTLVALNEKIGLDKRDSTLSQVLNSAKNSKTGKGKEMGSPLARKLEAACGKESGWMDTDPDLLAPAKLHEEVSKTAAALNQLPPKWQKWTLETVWSAIEAARAAMGMEGLPESKASETLAEKVITETDRMLNPDTPQSAKPHTGQMK